MAYKIHFPLQRACGLYGITSLFPHHHQACDTKSILFTDHGMICHERLHVTYVKHTNLKHTESHETLLVIKNVCLNTFSILFASEIHVFSRLLFNLNN